MTEKTKIFLTVIITTILLVSGNVIAKTMIQANSVSYKTSNGDTTDVNSALDSLFGLADISEQISELNSKLDSLQSGIRYNDTSNIIQMSDTKGNWVDMTGLRFVKDLREDLDIHIISNFNSKTVSNNNYDTRGKATYVIAYGTVSGVGTWSSNYTVTYNDGTTETVDCSNIVSTKFIDDGGLFKMNYYSYMVMVIITVKD
jgi:hypothetical protein